MLRTGNDRKKWYIRVEYDLSGGGGGVGGGGGGGGTGGFCRRLYMYVQYTCAYTCIYPSLERGLGPYPPGKIFTALELMCVTCTCMYAHILVP